MINFAYDIKVSDLTSWHFVAPAYSFWALMESWEVVIRGLFKKYREFWISAGYVYSIFNFFEALCWYSYPSYMSTSSAILNVRLILFNYFAWTCFGSSSIFASSVSRTRKSYRGPNLGNTVAAETLSCCFWLKIRVQATMCEQGRYHSAKANFCSSTNPGVSGGLLPANCA